MTPKNFPQANLTYTAPPSMPDCGDLPVLSSRGEILSCWELTDEDLATINNTRTIYLQITANVQPPVALFTEDPFA